MRRHGRARGVGGGDRKGDHSHRRLARFGADAGAEGLALPHDVSSAMEAASRSDPARPFDVRTMP
jgi:hypothetical protein